MPGDSEVREKADKALSALEFELKSMTISENPFVSDIANEILEATAYIKTRLEKIKKITHP